MPACICSPARRFRCWSAAGLAKMGAVAIYSVLVGCYLRWLRAADRPSRRSAPRISDVFDMLTYRERYEDLLARTGRDALTGAFDRGRLETQGRGTIDDAAQAAPAGQPAADRHRPLQELQRPLRPRRRRCRAPTHRARDHGDGARLRPGVPVRRRGVRGDLRGLTAGPALALGERVRREIAASVESAGSRVTVSIGVATTRRAASSTTTRCSSSPTAGSIRPRRRAAIA